MPLKSMYEGFCLYVCETLSVYVFSSELSLKNDSEDF